MLLLVSMPFLMLATGGAFTSTDADWFSSDWIIRLVLEMCIGFRKT